MIFSTTVLSGRVLHSSLLHRVLEYSNFPNIDISQGSAATLLRRDGILNNDFIANIIANLSAKEF